MFKILVGIKKRQYKTEIAALVKNYEGKRLTLSLRFGLDSSDPSSGEVKRRNYASASYFLPH